MPERFQQTELYIFLTKIIFPAFLAVGVKLAIEMKRSKNKISLLNVVLSMLIGVGGAYLASGVVIHNCKEEHVPLAIALIAMSSEKIGGWIIFKLNFDTFLTALFEGFFQYISNVFNTKK